MVCEVTWCDLADKEAHEETAAVVPAGEDAAATAGTTPNENLQDWWDLSQINVYDARTYGYDRRGQTVAILDTGVLSGHSWLTGKLVLEACFARIGNTNSGGCPNGSYAQSGTGTAAPCTYNVNICSHGTHVAGTAAGITGVAKGASIIAVQIAHPEYDGREPQLRRRRYTSYCDNVDTAMQSFTAMPSASSFVGSALTALQASGAPVYDSRNGITKSRINVWNAVYYLWNH